MMPMPQRPCLPHRPAAKQRGVSAIVILLFIAGAVAFAFFASDASRMTADATQLKRATDAAAIASTLALIENPKVNTQVFAERYVKANLGMDQEALSPALIVTTSAVAVGADKGIRVSASFLAEPLLAGAAGEIVEVHSAAVAHLNTVEVALTLPNTLLEADGNIATLQRLGKHFAQELLSRREKTWLALVPYSQSVNVSPDYTNPTSRTPLGPSPAHQQRLTSWTTSSALRPVELTSLFRRGYTGLGDRRLPDRRTNLLCIFRGLGPGQNYDWDRPPTGQFKVYYRADLPENGSPGADPVRWLGPNPMFGQATGADDARWMVADRGCPSAPLLPLTDDMRAIEERLSQMSARFNVNYAIAMGWSAMALSPAFRGAAGWNLPDELPKKFLDDDGNSYKAIVLLVNTTGQRWFDSDAYNAWVNTGLENTAMTNDVTTRRFSNLCRSLRERKVRFFMIAVGEDGVPNQDLGAEGESINAATVFQKIAGSGLAVCAEKDTDLVYLTGKDFKASEDEVKKHLDQILHEIRNKSAHVRLIE